MPETWQDKKVPGVNGGEQGEAKASQPQMNKPYIKQRRGKRQRPKRINLTSNEDFRLSSESFESFASPHLSSSVSLALWVSQFAQF